MNEVVRGQELLTVPEAGKLLRVSQATAYRYVAEGVLPTIRLSSRKRLVPRKAIDELIAPAVERAQKFAAAGAST